MIRAISWTIIITALAKILGKKTRKKFNTLWKIAFTKMDDTDAAANHRPTMSYASGGHQPIMFPKVKASLKLNANRSYGKKHVCLQLLGLLMAWMCAIAMRHQCEVLKNNLLKCLFHRTKHRCSFETRYATFLVKKIDLEQKLLLRQNASFFGTGFCGYIFLHVCIFVIMWS